MKIQFTAFDLTFLAMYAERINVVKRVAGVQSKKYDIKKSEWELHYVGAMGELAVKKAVGGELNLNIYYGGDPSPDITIFGTTAQIKAHTYTGRNLEFFIDDMSVFNAEILIGVQILSPVICDVVGYIEKERFKQIATPKSYGYGPRLSISANELTSITRLYKG